MAGEETRTQMNEDMQRWICEECDRRAPPEEAAAWPMAVGGGVVCPECYDRMGGVHHDAAAIRALTEDEVIGE